jgi:hypothetical protein
VTDWPASRSPFPTEVSSRLSRPAVGPERSAVEGPAVHHPQVSNLNGSAIVPFVIPTEAYPDFLPRRTGQDRVCAFLQGKGA